MYYIQGRSNFILISSNTKISDWIYKFTRNRICQIWDGRLIGIPYFFPDWSQGLNWYIIFHTSLYIVILFNDRLMYFNIMKNSEGRKNFRLCLIILIYNVSRIQSSMDLMNENDTDILLNLKNELILNREIASDGSGSASKIIRESSV